MGYGTTTSIDDVAVGINKIFKKINVYAVKDGNRILLYDKQYFMERRNINLENSLSINFAITDH
jgi:hypothetical protein